MRRNLIRTDSPCCCENRAARNRTGSSRSPRRCRNLAEAKFGSLWAPALCAARICNCVRRSARPSSADRPRTPGGGCHRSWGALEVESSRIGQAVGVSWFAGSCGHCAWCLEGRQNLCEQAEFTGWYRDGGYTTSMLARADCAFELPADYRPELTGEQRAVALSPLLCGGVIGYRSLRIARG